MGNKRKVSHAKSEKRIKQRERTHENLKEKYQKMIKEDPTSIHKKDWERKIDAL